ncbi:adenylate/guanylate cyclase domain-containing protein [Spirochaeta isovalerica]|uniref:Class 3 adenylate cyclase n=1 Tax=Spirochaeta isovalerica TaxID=150 RepID=A0A841RHQ1_9SPIO|nr:adenylate/guanylate cyclase domain-containing protein [Spirochaeta isovalerica]MBB6481832.1 class 3 adenylate cyclase [Spirochaeta isovalerica]
MMRRIFYLGRDKPLFESDEKTILEHFPGGDFSFDSPDDVPHLVLADLADPLCLDLVSALREEFPPDLLPLWSYGEQIPFGRENLFFALGGDRKGDKEALWRDAARFSGGERDLTAFDFPIKFSLGERASVERLIRSLQLNRLKKDLAEIPQSTSLFEKAITEFFRMLEEICHPHLLVLLFSSHLNVEAYVKPSAMLHREDYNDFRSFCLSDFFSYFKGLDLENPKETIFLGGRTDFDKISMDRQKISSYLCLPLKNHKGDVLATFHFGHLSNHYFNRLMIGRIMEFLDPLAVPFAKILQNHQTVLRQQKIFQIFSRFVPPDIIPQLVEQEKSKTSVKPGKQEVTVLFCDIRSFTTITESNGAQQVVEFLNHHFDAMVGAIEGAGGSIDKFIGDAIVAFFGVPQSLENTGKQSLIAAMDMVRNLKKVDTEGLILPEAGYSIGVGLHRGEAIVGNIGSLEKSDYTAIGDVIGIAEELEALTKEYPGHILASQSVFQSAGDDFPMKRVDRLENGVELYIPLWEDTEGAP